MKYFNDIKSIDEAKKVYKELAKTHHPDKGGCVEIMKKVNRQYEKILQGIFEEEGKSITEIEELLKNDALLREKLNAVLGLDDIEIEICGKWLWITGNTMIIRDHLKKCGFFWAGKKKAWYWRSEEYRSFNRKSYSLDEIRRGHGSISIKNERKQAIA